MKNLVQKDKQFRMSVKKFNFYRKFKRKKKIKKQQFLVKKFLNNTNNETKKNLTNKIIKKFQKTKTKNIIQKKFKKRIKILKNYKNSLKVNHQKLYNKNVFSNLKNKLFLFLKNIKNLASILVSEKWVFKSNTTISLIFLWMSPILCILWLIIILTYLALKKKLNFTTINKILIPVFSIWYLILWISLINCGPIIIGSGHTEALLIQMVENDIFFKQIAFSTVMWLNVLCEKIGIIIYLPFIKFKLSWFKKTSCAGIDKEARSKSSTKAFWNLFSKKEPVKTKKEIDADTCKLLAEQMARVAREKGIMRNPFFETEERLSEDGKRKSTFTSVSILGWFEQKFCYSRDASKQNQEINK